MSIAIENVETALANAMKIRPKVGGFPYLAEVLRRAGVTRNRCVLPACQNLYLTDRGPVVSTGIALTSGMTDVASFDREGLIAALREDQAGKTTFEQFLRAAWRAGVVQYEVDFEQRKVSYYGAHGEAYVEDYQAVDVPTR